MVFNLCSSAGVHGVFVRLFLAGGGPIGEVMVGSSAPVDGGAALDGPDIVGAGAISPDARLLFRWPVGDEDADLSGVSAVAG
jgi:hypothetical protein